MTRQSWWLIFTAIVLLGALIVDVPPLARFLGVKSHFKIHEGLDLVGGAQLIYQTDLTGIPSNQIGDAVTGVVNVVTNRINAFGVSEAVVQKTGDNSQVIIELPGVSDVAQAIKLIGETAKLEFRTPIDGKSIDANKNVISQKIEDWQDIGLTGAMFTRADVQISQSQTQILAQPEIAIAFNAQGTKLFSDATTKNIGKPIAIFLDNTLISAPTVKDAITDGKGVISGNFTAQTAKTLAIQLNAGALPVPIKLIEQNSIGATLGKESVRNSIVAGILGLLLVILFMLLYYRIAGVVAMIALIIYAAVALAIFIILPVTLSLPGIAGFLLSIGMAVDANILIFERTKEELRGGRSLIAAIEEGFRRAWPSIRDSNVSSLITTAILYYFGTGLVKGFALTLAIGILVSLFTAITVSRNLVWLFVDVFGLKNLRLWGVRKANINPQKAL
jgi:preprotein translocase subunit SecD